MNLTDLDTGELVYLRKAYGNSIWRWVPDNRKDRSYYRVGFTGYGFSKREYLTVEAAIKEAKGLCETNSVMS